MNIGTDINNEWVFEDGDLSLIDGEENLIQSISNRLNTVYDDSLYYSNYGGYLQQFIGWKKTEETRQFIQNEICNILNQETRITDYSIYTEYITDGILIKLNLKIDDEEINTEFILNDDGVIN